MKKIIETKEDMEKYLVRELKKIRKVWVQYLDKVEDSGLVRREAYLSLTVFRDSVMGNGSTKATQVVDFWEEVKDEESIKEN